MSDLERDDLLLIKKIERLAEATILFGGAVAGRSEERELWWKVTETRNVATEVLVAMAQDIKRYKASHRDADSTSAIQLIGSVARLVGEDTSVQSPRAWLGFDRAGSTELATKVVGELTEFYHGSGGSLEPMKIPAALAALAQAVAAVVRDASLREPARQEVARAQAATFFLEALAEHLQRPAANIGQASRSV